MAPHGLHAGLGQGNQLNDIMKKTAITAAIFLATCLGASARQIPVTKANYELAERFSPEKINRMVYTCTAIPHWFQNSDRFWYEWKDSEGTRYYIVDPASKKRKEVFDMNRLAMELTEIVKDPFDAQHIPFEDLRLKDDGTFTFRIKSTIDEPEDTVKKTPAGKKTFRFEYDIASGKLTDVTDDKEIKDYPDWANISPDGRTAIYAKGYNLYYMDMENLEKLVEDENDSTVVEHRLTSDGTKDVAYGGNNYQGVENVDTAKRYYVYAMWSPDSRYFVHEKYDMSGIKELWVINSLSEPRPTLETYKYQMPGEPGPKNYLMLFDMKDKTGRLLDVSAYKDQTIEIPFCDETREYLYERYFPLKWVGEDDWFYFSRLSRDQHRVDICRYDIITDSVHVLVKERLNTYIDVYEFEPANDEYDIVVRSERNGWAQLYLHDSEGNLKNRITDGPFHVSSIVGVDRKSGTVYFTATGFDREENPYYNHLFRVKTDGSGLKMLNPGNFDNRIYMSESLRYFVNSSSRVDTAPENVLYDNNGRKVSDLGTADFSQLFLAGYRFPEVFKVKAADGITDLWGVMYKPFDFDSTRLYPIIEYVYPGPQVEATNYFWNKGMNRIDRLAQMGFIVITVGQRGGHPDRSKWYHNFGYGNMRDYPLADHKYAIQQLAAQHGYIDVNRVGIHGHSGGGFMSTAAILTYPDFYKAAVSCAGNHDNRIYNRWWSETHHGVKENVSEDGDTTFNYSIKINEELVKNLKGHLLLVHGDIDDNVHPANTTRMVNALIRANKRFEMLYLPGQRHGFGDMDEYFFWKMADFFSRYLIGDYENDTDIRQMNNN